MITLSLLLQFSSDARQQVHMIHDHQICAQITCMSQGNAETHSNLGVIFALTSGFQGLIMTNISQVPVTNFMNWCWFLPCKQTKAIISISACGDKV